MKYFGVPFGCNMSRCSNWNTIIENFFSKLSSWKARILSVGRHLSLIKSVLGNLPTYYLSIYLMPVMVRNKLESMRNKFFIGDDQEDKKVTWSLYGADGSINSAATHYSMRITWGAILHSIFSLKQQGMDLLSLCTRNIRNGISTRNCSITSRVPLVDGSMVLRRDPRGGSELTQFNALKDAIGCVSLSDKRDSRICSLDRCNGFMLLRFRLKLNRLPSRVNLDRKGIDIGSILCPNCLEDIKTVNHIFFNCGMAQDLWALLAKWWELDIPLCANITEDPITRVEIKKVVWDCGGDRAPGPDGFTFKFFTTFWDLIEEDVICFVQEFFHSNILLKGYNSSFIALIPKVPNAKIVSDFRPISLIGCQYNIIEKNLANGLSKVIGSCTSPVQSAFLKGRNILDGLLF
nr:RNA-directed DNA polymerase, eukaryota, reverse transcriptase zinc-binding domain protein [Tanacetum cinerariifolium]